MLFRSARTAEVGPRRSSAEAGEQTRATGGEFGRRAARRRAERGLGKPETFNFLGFTHICGRTRNGAFALQRLTRRDRMQPALSRIKEQLHRNRHHAIPEQGAQLRQVVQGYFAYHAVPTNARRMSSFRHHVVRAWLWALRRRSQKDSFSWNRIKRLADHWLPSPERSSSVAGSALRRYSPKVGARS